jgi:peptidylprolyl isomerase
VLDTASPQFRTLAAAARQAKGADFSVCDVDLPVQVTGAPAG